MDAVQALVELGGVASTAELYRLSSRRKLRTAVAANRIRRVARDCYKLPHLDDVAAASWLNGVVSHASAAAHWDWKTKGQDWRPHVIVPRGRNVPPDRRRGVHLHWRRLAPQDVADGVTAPVRTVLDCAADLPFDEALAIADSALRSGRVGPEELASMAARLRGANSRRVRRVVEHADRRGMNPFESVLRAQAIEAGLDVTPQYEITIPGGVVHPDLVDPGRRLVLEADSWTFHAGREEHDRDCLRYTLLTTAGWWVLRFTWHQVMTPQPFSARVLAAWGESGPP